MGRRSIEEIRKEEIIDAFFNVVAEKGLMGASTREIATAAGCNHGMLRHYFGNKEAIIKGAVDHLANEYMTEIKEGMAKFAAATDQFNYIFNTFRIESFDASVLQAWLELLAFSKTNPVIREAFQSFYLSFTGIIAGLIRKGMQTGEFKTVDPGITADLICGSLEGNMLLIHINTNHTNGDLLNRQLNRVFLNYLVKET